MMKMKLSTKLAVITWVFGVPWFGMLVFLVTKSYPEWIVLETAILGVAILFGWINVIDKFICKNSKAKIPLGMFMAFLGMGVFAPFGFSWLGIAGLLWAITCLLLVAKDLNKTG